MPELTVEIKASEKSILCSGAKVRRPYYEKPKFTLYQGSCLELLGELPENSVDMVFADPPYNLSNGGITVHAGRMVSVNKGDWDKSNGL